MKNHLRKAVSLVISAAIVLSLISASAFAAAPAVYVDAALGSDENSGSSAAPFRTLQAAISAFPSAEIHFADGDYFFPETLRLTAENSGTKFIADGENVNFTGAKTVTAWKEAALNGRSCLVSDIGKAYSQVLLYDESGFLSNARLPDSGYYYLTGAEDATSDQETFLHQLTVCTSPADTASLVGADVSSAFIRIYHYWTEEVLKVASVDATGRIRFNQSYANAFCMNSASKGDAYCIENTVPGFTSAGEWYCDYSAGLLYYIPRAGETAENLALNLGVTETLISIDGASDVSFEGITFRDTGWNYTANYMQSAYNSKSCFTVKNASGISLDSCRFFNIGASAVDFGNWNTGKVTGSSVTACSFVNIGASAIAVGGPRTADCPSDILITENYVQNYGVTRRQAAGIFITNARNTTVTHNEIHDGLYTAVSVGWSWGYDKTYNENNNVSYNLIYDIGGGALSDMGGIYVLGIQNNSVISHNVIHNVTTGADATTYGGWGIYTDEGSTGWTITHNTVYDCGSQGFHQHYGMYNLVEYNVFAFNNEGQVRSSQGHVASAVPGEQYTDVFDGSQFTLKNNILLGDNQPMYQCLNENKFTDDGNIYWDVQRSSAVYTLNNKDIKLTRGAVKIGYRTNAYNGGIFRDPAFTDASNRNFTLSNISKAEEILGTDDFSTDFASVGSSVFGSAYLINDLAGAQSDYSSADWNNWLIASAEAEADRTPDTIAAVRAAKQNLESKSVPEKKAEEMTLEKFVLALLRLLKAVFGISAIC